MRIPARAALLAAMACLCGCRLVDQASFGGQPRQPAPDQLAAALRSGGTEPMLVVRPDDDVPYGDALLQAVREAESRNGNVHFRLVSVVPQTGGLAAQQAALAANAQASAQLLDDMGQAGISPERVTLEAQVDPHLARRELRLLVAG